MQPKKNCFEKFVKVNGEWIHEGRVEDYTDYSDASSNEIMYQKCDEPEKFPIVINYIGKNTGIANQDSFRNLSDSPIPQSVKHTPSKKEAKQTWYTSPMFTFIIWPLLVVIIGGFILFKLGWI
jgi:nitrate reductase NapE component